MFFQSVQKAQGWWPRLVAAAQIKKPKGADKRARQYRNVTEFLAWSFLLSHELNKDGHFTGTAHASHGDRDDNGAQPTQDAALQPANPLDGDDDDAASSNDTASSSANAPTDVIAADKTIATVELPVTAVSETFVHSAQSSGVSGMVDVAPFNLSADGGWWGGSGSFGGHGPGFGFGPGFGAGGDGGGNGIGGGPGSPGQIVYELAKLPTYAGLDAFVEKFGLGGTSTILAEEGMGSAKSTVAAAISFSQTPMTTLGFYVGSGMLDPHSAPLTIDGISVQYAVQANGSTVAGVGAVNDLFGFSNVQSAILNVADGSKLQSNTIQATDGQDWSGLLVVKGNYFEFNTIIQINLAWDLDTVNYSRNGPAPQSITQDGMGGTSAAGDAGHLLINTGSNSQSNHAKILDAGYLTDHIDIDQALGPEGVPALSESHGSTHQLIMGGTSQIYTVIQLNSLVGLDKIAFDFQSMLSSIGVSSDTGMFAQVMAGGDVQSNESFIHLSTSLPTITEDAFFRLHAGQQTTIIAGNYYEFNTIVQINFSNDNSTSTIGNTNSDGNATSTAAFANDGVFASGGNIQFNSAEIVKNDHADDLFVAGRYTQYNMVLQLNALNNSDTITQALGHSGTDDTLLHVDHGAADGGTGHSGTDGAMASAVDDASLRGHDALI